MNRADLPAKAHRGNPYNSTTQATRTQAQASTGDLRSQLLMRAFVVLALAFAAAGCASRPVEDLPALPRMEYFREVMVQTIPRGCWVEHNSGYVGVAPIVVRVRTSERGYPLGVNAITVQDSSGAWERKMVPYGAPVPERMLFDLRGLSGVRSGVSLGP